MLRASWNPVFTKISLGRCEVFVCLRVNPQSCCNNVVGIQTAYRGDSVQLLSRNWWWAIPILLVPISQLSLPSPSHFPFHPLLSILSPSLPLKWSFGCHLLKNFSEIPHCCWWVWVHFEICKIREDLLVKKILKIMHLGRSARSGWVICLRGWVFTHLVYTIQYNRSLMKKLT